MRTKLVVRVALTALACLTVGCATVSRTETPEATDAVALAATSVATSMSTSAAQAISACPAESLSEDQALRVALRSAEFEFFEDALVTVATLLTPEEYQDKYGGALKTEAPCFWRVEMSGSKIEAQMPWFGTPPPDIEWTEMVVVIEALSGEVEHTEGTGRPVTTPLPVTEAPRPIRATTREAAPAPGATHGASPTPPSMRLLTTPPRRFPTPTP